MKIFIAKCYSINIKLIKYYFNFYYKNKGYNMKIFKIALLMSLLILSSCSVNININKENTFSKEISSPDGSLKMKIVCENGFVKYSLKKNRKTIIKNSI